MKLSVHLVIYNGEKYLPYCLKSLLAQSFTDFSVLIIDNASQDNSLKYLESYLSNPAHKTLASKTKMIKNSRNLGFAGAHNQAIQWTMSELVFLMNQDVILDPDYLKQLVAFMDNGQAAAASGRIFRWEFNSQEELMDQDVPLTNQGKTDKIDTLGLTIQPNHKVSELADTSIINHQTNAPVEVFGVSGALPVLRRACLEHTKIPLFYKSSKLYINQTKPKLYEYFDNDFVSYKEDVDLAYRLRLFGYRAYLVPLARAWHDRSAAANQSSFKNRRLKSKYTNYHSYQNQLYFIYKNVPRKIWFKYFHRILLYELVKFAYIVLFEAASLKAIKQLIANFGKMTKKRAYLQKKVGPDAWRQIEIWLRSK